MKKQKWFLFTNLILITAILPFRASGADQNAAKNFLNSDFFSLSKKKENAFDAPSATYVLSSEDIRRSGMTSIPEALRLVPGLQVAKIDGNKWAISVRGFDRQYSNKLLVMIDGRIIYNSIFSGVFWDSQDYVMDDIDRIEVIRGPGGSIWGANAMNGIINIITKSASQTQGGYVSQIVGNTDRSITEVRYGNKTEKLDSYRVYAKHALRGGSTKPADGGKNDDGLRQDHAGFRYDIMSIKDSNISLHGDIYNDNSQNYFSTLNNPERNDKTNSGGNFAANWSKTLSKNSSFTLQTYYDYNKIDIPILQIYERTFDVDFQHFYNFSRENQFIWGIGYKNIQDSIKSGTIPSSTGVQYLPFEYSPNTRNIETWSAFMQDKFGLIANSLYLTVGSKFEINDLTGFEYQPNARLTFYPSRNQTVWAAVSRAIRTPTRGEDNLKIRATPTVVAQQGSNTYRAEDVLAYELGYRVKPTEKTTIDISSFYNKYSRLRTFDAVGSDGNLTSTPNSGTPTANNNGYGETYGFEIDGKWQVLDIWRLEASYDVLKTALHLNGISNENNNTRLNTDPLERSEGYSPRSQFRIRSLLNLTPKLEFDNLVFYTNSLTTAGPNSPVFNATAGTASYSTGVKPYTRWDTRFGYLLNRNLDVSFGIQNILKSGHQEFKSGLFTAPSGADISRTYYIKAVLQF